MNMFKNKFKNKKTKLLDSTLASETLKKIGKKKEEGSTKIAELIEDFHENGILLAMIFFALPVAMPLPYPPGFTTVMGLPLIILLIQMINDNKKVKLPQRVSDYEIKNSTFKMISNKIVSVIETVEKYVKPRMNFAKSVYCEQLVGFICFVAVISVAIPIPLTNAIPVLGITVMALDLLNRDEIVIIVGIAVTFIGIFIALSAMIAGWMAIKYLFHTIF